MARYHWWNSPGFRDDDGSLQWRDVLRHFRSRWHVAVMRLDNRVQDSIAYTLGACNVSPWNGRGYAGGYSHWRCMKARRHLDPHRFNNYTWTGNPDDGMLYEPLEVRRINDPDWRKALPFAFACGGRRAVERRSRSRELARQAEISRAIRKAMGPVK